MQFKYFDMATDKEIAQKANDTTTAKGDQNENSI